MSVTFSPPVITGNSTEEKLQAVQSWLFQFTGQLQHAINNLDTSNFSQQGLSEVLTGTKDVPSVSEVSDEFKNLRALIIKTADTVQASYDELSATLKTDYVASSEFGSYKLEASNAFSITADGTTQNFTRFEEVASLISNVSSYIKTGYLEQLDAYGVAIGEERLLTDVDGNEYEYFDQFATLTSDELAFWTGGVKIGYFKGDSLFVNGSIRVGSWNIEPSDGLSIKYVSGGE